VWDTESQSVLAKNADAATAIQAAVDRASDDGGGRVVVASGEYRIDRSIVPKDGVMLAGAGPDSTTLVGTPELEGNGEKPLAIVHSESRLRDVTIEGFEFDGSEMHRPTGPAEYRPYRKAIHSWYSTRLVIQNNWVHDTAATGIGNDFNV